MVQLARDNERWSEKISWGRERRAWVHGIHSDYRGLSLHPCLRFLLLLKLHWRLPIPDPRSPSPPCISVLVLSPCKMADNQPVQHVHVRHNPMETGQFSDNIVLHFPISVIIGSRAYQVLQAKECRLRPFEWHGPIDSEMTFCQLFRFPAVFSVSGAQDKFWPIFCFPNFQSHTGL